MKQFAIDSNLFINLDKLIDQFGKNSKQFFLLNILPGIDGLFITSK